MPDFSKKRSLNLNLRRRVAPRTPSKRPCLLWKNETPEIKKKGIILDLNMYGLKVRTSEIYEIGQELSVQMMKDNEYNHNLGVPIIVTVVRSSIVSDGYIDYGMKRILMGIKKTDKRGEILAPPLKNLPKKKITETSNITIKANNK